jgi:hypothetical protein
VGERWEREYAGDVCLPFYAQEQTAQRSVFIIFMLIIIL